MSMLKPAQAPRPHLTFRPEVQGLRAIAVLAVFAFHLWPSGGVSGGYVGVDVFFVISGFLITGLLLKEFEATAAISIGRFYSRRIRRLLPAATLAMLAIAVCIPLFPPTRWADIGSDIAASALYVQNWHLAARAVDYLASQGAESPLQHFWSLAVEEQYYIIWPLLALLAVKLTRKATEYPRAAFGIFVLLIGVASFAWSVYLSPRVPGLAYFATTTRAWELALGGALAVFRGWNRWPSGLRAVAGYTGMAMIVVSCVVFGQGTVFPGYAAALPTVGCALVILCGGGGGRFGVRRWLALRPFQYFGDISYSLYLWHWPVIIVYGQLHDGPVGWLDALVIFVVSTSLAHQSKVYVEDRFRFGHDKRQRQRRDWRPVVLGMTCIVASLASAGAVSVAVKHKAGGGGTARSVADHPGATVLISGVHLRKKGVPYLPRPILAKDDTPVAYRTGCHQRLTGAEVKECKIGNKC